MSASPTKPPRSGKRPREGSPAAPPKSAACNVTAGSNTNGGACACGPCCSDLGPTGRVGIASSDTNNFAGGIRRGDRNRDGHDNARSHRGQEHEDAPYLCGTDDEMQSINSDSDDSDDSNDGGYVAQVRNKTHADTNMCDACYVHIPVEEQEATDNAAEEAITEALLNGMNITPVVREDSPAWHAQLEGCNPNPIPEP